MIDVLTIVVGALALPLIVALAWVLLTVVQDLESSDK